MDKYYFIKTTRPLNFASLSDLIGSHLGYQIEIITRDEQTGYFSAPSDLAVDLSSYLPLLSNDFNAGILIFVSPKKDEIAELFLKRTPIKNPGLYHLSELLLAALIDREETIIQTVAKTFRSIPHQLLQTADVYIQCGLNGNLAAEKLYLHRNTFLYRLNQFYRLTGIDIRDYWNAQYFALVKQILINE
ncbi:MAG: helix-turn-helix domain-containing protein [Bacilli bacterium]